MRLTLITPDQRELQAQAVLHNYALSPRKRTMIADFIRTDPTTLNTREKRYYNRTLSMLIMVDLLGDSSLAIQPHRIAPRDPWSTVLSQQPLNLTAAVKVTLRITDQSHLIEGAS